MTIGPQITIFTHHFGNITNPTKAWLVADLFPEVADVATFAVHRNPTARIYPWHITNIETGFMVPGTGASTRERAIKLAIAISKKSKTNNDVIRNAVEQHNLHNHPDTPCTSKSPNTKSSNAKNTKALKKPSTMRLQKAGNPLAASACARNQTGTS